MMSKHKYEQIEVAMEKVWQECQKAQPEMIYVDGTLIRMAQEPTPGEAVCNQQWLRRLMSSKVQ